MGVTLECGCEAVACAQLNVTMDFLCSAGHKTSWV